MSAAATTPATTPPAITPVSVVDLVVVFVTAALGAELVCEEMGTAAGAVVETDELVPVVVVVDEAVDDDPGLTPVVWPSWAIQTPAPVVQQLSATLPIPQQ